MQMTESDLAREQRIATLGEQIVAAPDGESRHRALCAMQDEIKARTPAAVAYLETRMGLA